MGLVRAVVGAATAGSALVLLAGCADYPAVGTLAKGMSQSLASWAPITGDYAATCTRRLAYAENADTACAPFQRTQGAIEADLAVLDDYFAALAAIATDTNYSVDPAEADLADVAGKARVDGDEIEAANHLASIVAGWFTSGLRQRSLNGAIAAVPDAIAVLDHVQSAINHSYPGQLELEATQWQIDMVGPAARADAVARSLSKEPALLGPVPLCDVADPKPFRWRTPAPVAASMDQFLFQRQYEARCNSMKDHRNALNSFDASVAAVRQSLTELRANRARLKTKATIALLFDQAKDLYRKTKAVKRAFATPTIATDGATAS